MAEFKLVAGPGRRPTNSERSFLRGCSILIVEDEPLMALDLHAALYAAGAGIIAATNAQEALRLIRRNEISAAVIDIRLGNQVAWKSVRPSSIIASRSCSTRRMPMPTS